MTKAREIAHTYVHAIANKDVDAILSVSAEGVVCNSPLGQTIGIERFRDFHEGFARMITGLTVLAVFGDEKQAVVIYDVQTHPVPHAVVAELIKIDGDRLASTHVIYDATPFAAYATTARPH